LIYRESASRTTYRYEPPPLLVGLMCEAVRCFGWRCSRSAGAR